MVDKRQPIQNIATYRVPMTAVLNSRPVRIIATGDQPGHSPVCQYVNDNGRIDWAGQEEFQVIDSQFLPPSQEALRELGRTLSQA